MRSEAVQIGLWKKLIVSIGRYNDYIRVCADDPDMIHLGSLSREFSIVSMENNFHFQVRILHKYKKDPNMFKWRTNQCKTSGKKVTLIYRVGYWCYLKVAYIRMIVDILQYRVCGVHAAEHWDETWRTLYISIM